MFCFSLRCMVQAYNFIGSWQLFPEKGNYQKGDRPKSGTCTVGSTGNKQELQISSNWVSLENQAFEFSFSVLADGMPHPYGTAELADTVALQFTDGIYFSVFFYRHQQQVLELQYELMPNGYLRKTERGEVDGESYTNQEYFHRQMSVLPYAASVSGAVIKPTEQGVIRHKALTAMEEQTNMQLEQIRKQIELLALQAQEIQQRKELSMRMYNAQLSFQPVIGQVYYLYEKKDGSHIVSMVSPQEWGSPSGPYQHFEAKVKLLADHTWIEVL